MDLLTLYVVGYFCLAVFSMLLLEKNHATLRRTIVRAHDDAYAALLISFDACQKANQALELANQILSDELHQAQRIIAHLDLSSYEAIDANLDPTSNRN
jgi:hypothetical protein